MDLAKIRKKAKALKQGDEPNVVAEERRSARESSSVQAVPANIEVPVVVEPEADSPAEIIESTQSVTSEVFSDQDLNELPVEVTPSRPRDPLDELFRQTPDIQLATEESYLQALTDDQTVSDDLRQWLTFSLADEVYALDIDTIDEICKPREVTEIPNAPKFVLGIISLRGKVVPVYDLRCRLQLGSIDITPTTRIVVCQTGEKLVGLLVDSITQVVRLANSDIEPPPMVLSGLDRDMVEGVGRSQGGMLILLNLSNVITIDTD